MSSDDRVLWDRKHGEAVGAQAPCEFLREIIEGRRWNIRPGRVLDIACGRGRNAIFLAAHDFQVTAIDISSTGLAEVRKQAEINSLSIDSRQADLENFSGDMGEYDLVVNINYLQRSLVPHIKQAVRSGGHVIFATFLIDQQTVGHPSHPNYLLSHNELLDYFRDFRVLLYREGMSADGAEPSFRAGILAQKVA